MAMRSKASRADPASDGPSKWWQWLLVYPALGLAIITAVPEWSKAVWSTWNATEGRPAEEALRQNELWRRNMRCLMAPFEWYVTPHNVKVDTTTCRSGDVLIRAETPDRNTVMYWAAIDDVLATVPGQKSGLIRSANADILRFPDERRARTAPAGLTQYAQTVVCQHFVDNRVIVRHIHAANGCFDEYVDTYTGRVINVRQVPCRPPCR